MRVVLHDYGAGNLHSLAKALERGGAEVRITPDWEEALASDALVLPGVGSFGAAVRSLEGEAERVRRALADGLPCLGICLGMQLLFEGSDEGEGAGIGLLKGRVRRLRGRTIPQMGWNEVEAPSDPLFRDLSEADRAPSPTRRDGTPAEPRSAPVGSPSPLVAYFAHSFVCDPEDAGSVVAWTTHEGERFPAAVRHGRTLGVQFHPEKSSGPGLRLIAGFLREVGEGR